MRKVIFGLLVLVASFVLLGVACDGGGLFTITGKITTVEYESTEFVWLGGEGPPITVVFIEANNGERYYLAIEGLHDTNLHEGQTIEVTFDRGDTVVKTGVRTKQLKEDGTWETVFKENVELKKIISYTILDTKK